MLCVNDNDVDDDGGGGGGGGGAVDEMIFMLFIQLLDCYFLYSFVVLLVN